MRRRVAVPAGACLLAHLVAVLGRPKEPVTRRPACLSNTSRAAEGEPGLASIGDDDPIDIAFYDTRPRVSTASMLAAAALANTSSRVRFHALLRYPVRIPGFRVHSLSLPPAAKCLYDGMARLAHGPGPQYLYKPLLHWVMPKDVRKLILLDTDVIVVRDIARLYAQFGAFGTAVVAIANEQSLLYQRGSNWKMEGKNGGVQLLDLQRMRRSSSYARALDRVASGEDGRRIGYLGDQTLYTFLAADYPRLFHTLPCEWNRQLSMHFGFRNVSVHACPRRCGIAHANYGPFKCVAKLLQRDPSCTNWARFASSLIRRETSTAGRLVGGKLLGGRVTIGAAVPACPKLESGKRSVFHRAIIDFFGDCCVPDANLSAYRPPARPTLSRALKPAKPARGSAAGRGRVPPSRQSTL